MGGNDFWDWFFTSPEMRTRREVERTDDDVRALASQHAETSDEIRTALRRNHRAVEHLAGDVRALTAMLAALGEALAVANVVDGDRLRERFQERLQQLSHKDGGERPHGAGGAKIVHVRACEECGAKNRGDIPACVKCGASLA